MSADPVDAPPQLAESGGAGGDGGPPGGDGGPPDDGQEAPEDELSEEELKRREKWKRRRQRAREFAVLAGKTVIVIALFVFVIFFDRIIHSVYPGEVGVLWSRLGNGTVLDKFYSEGLVVTWPWDRFYKYDVREQELERDTVIYAQDGLEITVHTSVRFRLLPPDLPRLHQDIGPDYIDKVIVPETISTLRRVLGNYTPERIYAKDEQGLLGELTRTLRTELDRRYFQVTEFLVLELRLPEAIEDAIKDKLTQEQQRLSYRFRLETEKDEKERRIIEAEGLKAFETISGVPILKWRGIEATEALARSPSAKIVLMGTGSDQLPIILNADASPPPTPVQPAGTLEPARPERRLRSPLEARRPVRGLDGPAVEQPATEQPATDGQARPSADPGQGAAADDEPAEPPSGAAGDGTEDAPSRALEAGGQPR